MSLLTIYHADGSTQAVIAQHATISQTLAEIGVGFSFCASDVVLPPQATDAHILTAHQGTITALQQQYGYQSVDVVRMHPQHPQKAEFRQKFLAEHTHDDDEVRLFTEGSGLFVIHAQNMVYALVCTAGDLIRLPAGMMHWFDMGTMPLFTAIRLFTSPDGWVAQFTGSDMATRFEAYTPAVQAIVTDIEGTTSSISFVHQVLFPYARTHLPAYVRQHAADLAPIIAQVQQIAARDLTLEQVIEQLLAWLDADQKITPLKTLQGLIWQQGYADGVLKSDVYPDALTALHTWNAQGLRLYVYSSGSIAAQKLLFQHTSDGDITPLFTNYFDTTIGAKTALTSYVAIAQQCALPPPAMVFLSDNLAEITAARAAGMRAFYIDRSGAAADDAFATFDALAGQWSL